MATFIFGKCCNILHYVRYFPVKNCFKRKMFLHDFIELQTNAGEKSDRALD